ncbi:PDZ domain-containing protein [Peribacillus loiseleuriae]|uniref:PDZ domain-containing protein n=1 Tax=Peribacillus loiseleuriae TaxID=1679170 RepID=UPI001FE18430|nr:PDZ domain-containing protein [Peribacillus loiseleuriae]
MGWLVASLQGIGMFFLHPVFYVSIILSLFVGYLRVKRERRGFTIRINSLFQELRQLLPIGLLIGVLLSILTIGSGVVIPFAAILLMGIFTILLSLTFQVRLLSPAYIVGLSFLTIVFLAGREIEIPIFSEAFHSLDQPVYPSLAVLLGLLLLAEGILISKGGSKQPSPNLMVSKRGQVVGTYKARKIWLLPLFIFVPGGELVAPIDWYPVFSIGELHFTPIAIPVLIGFSKTIQGSLPQIAIQAQARKVTVLAVIVTTLAVFGNWYSYLSIVAVVLAMLGRELIHYFSNMNDRKLPFYFSQSKLGVKILGVIPHTPADKMGLEMGEIIMKMNGSQVSNEHEFYGALQKNRAHCKMEVIGHNGEIRFVQRALFEGEHHELGLLFIEEGRKERSRAIL